VPWARLVGLLLFTASVAGCGMLGQPQAVGTPPQRSVPQIGYIGADDQVYVSQTDGSAARLLTARVAGLSNDQGWTYRWPTYSPDGRHLAFAGYRSQSGALLSSAVLSADVDQANSSVVLESTELAPIYLYWSPDSRHLTALFQRGSNLELHLLDGTGKEAPRQLLVGSPLYWSWSPDGKTLAVHVGADPQSNDTWVGLLHVTDASVQEERFPDAPGGFRAPAWAPGAVPDKLAYVALGGGTSILSVRNAAGQVTRITSSATDVAFNWSPQGDWLAFASASPDTPATYTGLEAARADGSERHRLSQDALVAFYWAPDGKRLAVLGLDSAAQALSWSIVSVDGKLHQALTSFVPSSDFAFQLPFFDQYAQSTRLWSADGQKLVYGAADGSERRNGSALSEQVMLLDASGQAAPAPIAPGSVAVWSPAE
jgi:TolB protein